jgi:hypothetical protein
MAVLAIKIIFAKLELTQVKYFFIKIKLRCNHLFLKFLKFERKCATQSFYAQIHSIRSTVRGVHSTFLSFLPTIVRTVCAIQ